MISSIPISILNDYIFRPLSVYFSCLYRDLDTKLYKNLSTEYGNLAHESVDNNQYSHRKHVLCGVDVYSEKYNVYGKIDVFNVKTGELVERKGLITYIYDGYVFQLYAQYFCLIEMGYSVNTLKLYSKADNKFYTIKKPSENLSMFKKFENLIQSIHLIDLSNFEQTNIKKCKKCIYRNCCKEYIYDE